LVELTIIMPAYNERATVIKAVDEVLETQYPLSEFEVVIVDDGSTDGTRELLLRHEWPDNVRVLTHERNKGKGAAVKTALAEARGKWAVTMDTDLEYAAADLPQVIEPLLDGHVAGVSRQLADGLWRLRDRIDTPEAALRGAGLWFGLDLGQGGPASAKDVAAAALSRGLVVNPVTDTVLRLAPPLVIEEADIEEGLLRLGGALEEVGACR